MGTTTVKRVLVVDDHDGLRQSLVLLLQLEKKILVVGSCSNGQEAVTLARELEPDVIVMDLAMPVMDGLEATRIIHQEFEDIRIIVWSAEEPNLMGQKILAAGAVGYLNKSGAIDDLLQAIHGKGLFHPGAGEDDKE